MFALIEENEAYTWTNDTVIGVAKYFGNTLGIITGHMQKP